MLQDPASGLSFPDLYNLFSTFDPGERPTLISITYPGGKCMAFYVSSTTGMVWYGLFCALIYSMSENLPQITRGELEYLGGTKSAMKKKLRISLIAVLRGNDDPKSMYSIALENGSHLCSAMGYYSLILLILSTTAGLFVYIRAN